MEDWKQDHSRRRSGVTPKREREQGNREKEKTSKTEGTNYGQSYRQKRKSKQGRVTVLMEKRAEEDFVVTIGGWFLSGEN